ncbi:DUF423 domain-containing protein [Hirschia baltica]|uniref:DUF423 domain-containing protein n=1 Tax=Hirschia baltica (strain ATCC 49814 / DSM 5838 / IFAM 1418) TaxID=582402 RepID=C6XIU5_HIRBI|nr:DUF423 domain-containing protein [Hirschia baltica]ACT59040.1 protein of unknown function DUF423 [Hirschia baltica ATCC 49814]
MSRYTCFKVAALFAFLAVMLGAFGAHGLRGLLDERHLATFETGVRYQFYHAVGLFIIGFLITLNQGVKWLGYASYFLSGGIILFSGSLYLLACNQIIDIPAWVGPITPLGGLCLMIGWGCVFISQFSIKA